LKSAHKIKEGLVCRVKEEVRACTKSIRKSSMQAQKKEKKHAGKKEGQATC
jgi:hypothetical protein